jgi:signal transduction histidine kinase
MVDRILEPFRYEDRILILATVGRDAQLIARSLTKKGFVTMTCPTFSALNEAINEGAAAALIVEEALNRESLSLLSEVMNGQPAWSDFPLIVLTNSGDEAIASAWGSLEALDAVGNVTLLERPIEEVTLQSAAKVALRARHRQYQVRNHLEERLQNETALRNSEQRYRTLAQELDARVREQTAELTAANRELEGFTYSIAHDLRSPLRRLMFNSEIIQQDYAEQLDDEGKATLGQLAAESKKLSVMVEDLLQYARLWQMPIQKRQVDVSAIAEQALEHLDFGGTMKPEVQPGLTATADATLLEMVLLNLLDNARKYGDPKKDCKIVVGFDEQAQAYFVKDNGIGFSMEFAYKMFLPFERLHRDVDYPGTGIGLANVKRIIDLHGGHVWAEGEEGKGAKFLFTLG